jgi:hypothetical protein
MTGIGIADVLVSLEFGAQGERPGDVVLRTKAVGPGAVAARFSVEAEDLGLDAGAVHAEPAEDRQARVHRPHEERARVERIDALLADAFGLGLAEVHESDFEAEVAVELAADENPSGDIGVVAGAADALAGVGEFRGAGRYADVPVAVLGCGGKR